MLVFEFWSFESELTSKGSAQTLTESEQENYVTRT